MPRRYCWSLLLALALLIGEGPARTASYPYGAGSCDLPNHGTSAEVTTQITAPAQAVAGDIVTVVLEGEEFKGFLLHVAASDCTVGVDCPSFDSLPAGTQKKEDCSSYDDSVTHSDSDAKTSVVFSVALPRSGTVELSGVVVTDQTSYHELVRVTIEVLAETVQCMSGTSDDDSDPATPCVQCDIGTYGAGGSAPCEVCAAGSADDDSDPATPCVQCNIGTYGEGGPAPCVVCAAGTADTDNLPSTLCELCGAGTYAAEGSTVCEDCPDGTTDEDSDASTPCSVADPHLAGAQDCMFTLFMEDLSDGNLDLSVSAQRAACLAFLHSGHPDSIVVQASCGAPTAESCAFMQLLRFIETIDSGAIPIEGEALVEDCLAVSRAMRALGCDDATP